MQKKNKYLSVEIYPELHYKLRYISEYEERSANRQIIYLIRQCIKEFERENGEIILPDSETEGKA